MVDRRNMFRMRFAQLLHTEILLPVELVTQEAVLPENRFVLIARIILALFSVLATTDEVLRERGAQQVSSRSVHRKVHTRDCSIYCDTGSLAHQFLVQ